MSLHLGFHFFLTSDQLVEGLCDGIQNSLDDVHHGLLFLLTAVVAVAADGIVGDGLWLLLWFPCGLRVGTTGRDGVHLLLLLRGVAELVA